MGVIFFLWNLLFFSACSSSFDKKEADRLNGISYSFHYKNTDSAMVYAEKALSFSSDYETGRAEALNNLAFINIVKMNYEKAKKLLDSIACFSDNQIELLVADVQYMRICQRESRNKEFYDYKEHAESRVRRINEEREQLTEHQIQRFVYAKSELAIVSSTYYYYVGLERLSSKVIANIDENAELQMDTAQYLNYLYQVGSGGVVYGNSKDDILRKEIEYLIKCYILAKKGGYIYWEANSLQSLSEHLIPAESRGKLLKDYSAAFELINKDNMPDSLIAGNLAQRSLELFIEYGDVYQIAGSFRTLASCYWAVNDYKSSLFCLDKALNYNKAINQAPDLVASIREQLSLVYSAIDDKRNSDKNRNIYLDLQESTRQDRQLDARAEQLDRYSSVLNIMIGSIIVLIILVLILISIFYFKSKRKKRNNPLDDLLKPLHEWKKNNDRYIESINEDYELINEKYNVSFISLVNNKRRNIENQAKIFLANSAIPLIDRMVNETRKLCSSNKENDDVRKERLDYILELSEKIGEYNDVLAEWIQLRQGQINLHIESFSIKELFEILEKSSMSFRLKGITLIIENTDDIVKADKVLTLFMLNTIADNARKFTPSGGTVSIYSVAADDYVEISVKDTGEGLSEEKQKKIFSHKISNGHGFGLANCRGIIEQYRKISSIFNVCRISVESNEGKGSRFYFRLPKGIIHGIMVICIMALSLPCKAAVYTDTEQHLLKNAEAYADSAYKSNIRGEYHKTIAFVDSAKNILNLYYQRSNPKGMNLMTLIGNIPMDAAELRWFHDKIDVDYGVILSLRDECAVAALALHDWQLYHYNNKVYTQLYKEVSTDRNLAEYCRIMQRAELNKNIAIIILVVLFLIIIFAYYFLYYRHVLYSKSCIERVKSINNILLSNSSSEEKKRLIHLLDSDKYPLELKNIVQQIKEAIQYAVEEVDEKSRNVELAKDELRRINLENDKIYVSNNILDNCLSALKHETMYYPSRIKVLAERRDENIDAIYELLLYYKELYTILSAQTMLQIKSIRNNADSISLEKYTDTGLRLRGDIILFEYMLEILKKVSGQKQLNVTVGGKGDKYVLLSIYMPMLRLTEQQCKELFTPLIQNIPFLICRQIVRNNSESTNLSGCGIVAEPAIEDGVVIRIVMARDRKVMK